MPRSSSNTTKSKKSLGKPELKNKQIQNRSKQTKCKNTTFQSIDQMRSQIKKKNQTPSKSTLEMSKVLRDSDLYLNPITATTGSSAANATAAGNAKSDNSKVVLDLRLPSTQLFQDNMLSMLRLINYHPFSGILKLQDITKNDLSIKDLPNAIKSGTIKRTSQFDFLVSQIFTNVEKRLAYMHESLNKIIEEEKIKFIQNSQHEVFNELLGIRCCHERLAILKECNLVDDQSFKSQSQEFIQSTGVPVKSVKIEFTANDADKILKLRRILAKRRLIQ